MAESSESQQYTRRLAEYVVETQAAALPETVMSQARTVVLDTLTSLVGSTAPSYAATRVVHDYVRQAGGAAQASVSGLRARVPAANAALANGTLADNLELDDSHPRTGAHIASSVIPAALAAAEWGRCDGASFLAAIVVAYDLECRAILAANPASMYARGFHPSAVLGAFGATAAAAKLLGLDVERTINALGLAGSQASGLMAWETDPTQMPKSLQLGIAARNGITAAALARAGFSGPPAIFEGRYNVLHAFSNDATFEPLLEELGTRYEINLTGLKLYPVCRFLHATLDAFFEIQRRYRPPAAEIVTIQVRMPRAGVRIIDNNELRSHNVQYVLALAALRGPLRVADIYRDERSDPRVAELMARVHVGSDARLDADAAGRFSEPAEVTIRMTNGRDLRARADAASGDPEKALDWAAVVTKFTAIASGVVGTRRTRRLITCVENLDQLDDMGQLGALLRSR